MLVVNDGEPAAHLRRNGGRVFAPTPDRLGEYLVRDYLRARRRAS